MLSPSYDSCVGLEVRQIVDVTVKSFAEWDAENEK